MSKLDALLRGAVEGGVTPGASLCVAWREAGAWRTRSHVAGTLAWDDVETVSPSTRYDLASITKAFTAWTAAALSARGAIDLRAPIGAWVDEARGLPVGACTLDALLSHRAGLPAWRPLYAQVEPAAAGTPEARARVLHEALREVPSPDGRALYSDLGYILAGVALGRATGAPLAEVLREGSLGDALRFGPVDPAGTAPTERCAWRGRVVRAEVHDENCFALGGTAGHAGLFGAAPELCARGVAAVDALREGAPWMLAMLAPREGGSHRLGWDTRSPGGSSAGALMGPRTFGHLGFTGTSLWCDPDAEVVVALLTNRVHPTRAGEGIRALRPAVHDAVMRALPR